MRSRLLQSFLFVFGFWWIGTALFWSLLDPDVHLEALRRVTGVFPWVSVTLPEHVTVLNAWTLQKQIVMLWSLPLAGAVAASAALGAGASWFYAWREDRKRASRLRSEGEHRGVTVSIGTLPLPRRPAGDPVQLGAHDDSLGRLSEEQRALLGEVFGVLAAHRDAFPGEGRAPGSLFGCALHHSNKALRQSELPGLCAIVAAAAELGQLTAWKKNETGAWIRVRSLEREAARALCTLATWWSLPNTERLAVLFAVKYRMSPSQMPRLPLNPGASTLACRLIEQLAKLTLEEAPPVNEAVPTAPAEQKIDPQSLLLELFERELATMPFQTPRLPKNIPAVGWRKGQRAYLLENRIVDCLLPKVPPSLRTWLSASIPKKRIEALTAGLLKLFHEQGWLVLTHGTHTVSPDEALWVILAGKLEFSRVIILDLPPHMLERLPGINSHYDVTIERPFFAPAAPPAISKDDLMGDMLRPKSTATKPAG